ncbi:MAG: L-lactate dehydrogenase [Ruminococcus sp.]|nr:L-lactate dehydrogenase [Ruminococcus sp.]
MGEVTKKGTKISILGAGNVGASIAFTLAVAGTCSEIVLIDIAKDKAKGEAMDIRQGTEFCSPVNIYDGEYEDCAGSDIVVVTLGRARKPGQTRLDLAQGNVDIIKSVMPQVAKAAPDAVYVIVSNPVDILTYAILKCTDLSPSQVIGSGTALDTSRLCSFIADKTGVNTQSVNAYVLGEHGDSSMVPWSIANIGGVSISDLAPDTDLDQLAQDMRVAGAEVIKRKGATFYAIALSVNKICDTVLRDQKTVLPVSTLINDKYGISDVCLSLPFIVGRKGIEGEVLPKLTDDEVAKLQASSDALKEILSGLKFD